MTTSVLTRPATHDAAAPVRTVWSEATARERRQAACTALVVLAILALVAVGVLS